MSRTSQIVQIGKRKIELSNLQKVLYPDDGVLKAEVIQYYLKIAPTILRHIRGRPLSLVRFPDGVHGERFFQKNRPDWAPDWMEQVKLDHDKPLVYLMASEEASMVWLANLACLELHQYHSRKPHFSEPDYFVFDLDPPEGDDFRRVVGIALQLKEQIESFGYHPFVKTTGGKGLHVVVPIEPKWDFHTAFEAAQSIAKPFVEANPKETTLHIKKEARKGRVLVDIYRNRSSQSIVAPYSLRGRRGCPVSTPLPWEELETLEDPAELNINATLARVLSDGDPWEAIGAYAVALHTKRESTAKPAKELPPSRKHKTPEQLEEYARKRSFDRTAEPEPEFVNSDGNGFVVHRHHASRLHYDLRLEQGGTLKSWAVPRGMPPRPGIKRLAVATEDHPMKYLTWEGEIPKGQYGGGMMWVYALGRYEITKEKKDGFYFRLESRELNSEYRMYQTKGSEWLLERLDNPQVDWLQQPVEPMLAGSLKKPPRGDEYIYEVKWDGIRALIALDEGQITIRSRNQRDITEKFPELNVPEQAFRATAALFDAEIVCLEADGRPSFKKVINRLQQRSEGAIERAGKRNPVVCYIFDCLYLDGRPLIHDPLHRRRAWLKDAVKRDTPYRVSDYVLEGEQLFEAAKQMGLEGIIAKDINSLYHPGKRSSSWYKIKTRQTAECMIIGYTKGKGSRESVFGALQLADRTRDGFLYRGKVGSGFDDRLLKSVYEELKTLAEIERPIDEKPIDDANTVWIEPRLFCEIEYASITPNKTYREPVFLRLRQDLE